MKSSLLITLLSTCMIFAFTSKIEAKRESKPVFHVPVFGTNHVVVEKEKTYCSPSAKTKYKVLISKDKIRITRLYKEYKDVVTGVIKNGKIYSNNPEEKRFKPVWGKLYKLNKGEFGVLNTENGDYEWFSLCNENITLNYINKP